MKSRFLIFTSLVLTVLCIGSASNAMAQSVTGGGIVQGLDGTNAPLVLTVSARIGADGPTGTLTLGDGSERIGAKVVDLCILNPSNPGAAYVTAQITRSTTGFNVGDFIEVFIVDFGNDQNNPDVFLFGLSGPVPAPCGDFDPFIPFPFFITGNFTVNP